MTAMRAGCGEIDCTAPVYDDMFILDCLCSEEFGAKYI